MADLVCITDSHIGARIFNKTVFEKMMVYFETEVFPYLIENGIKNVLHLGDLVHNRTLMDNHIDGQFKKRFFRWFEKNKITIWCLVGNHDSYFKNTIEHNYQRANLKEFKYVKVIDKPLIQVIEKYKIGFMPWMTNVDEIHSIPKANEIDLLCGHFEIHGALMQGKSYSRSGISYDLFKDYKLTLSGHFHATSRVDNFRYLGTQYQTNWSDYGNDKGFWTLGENWEMKYHRNTSSPKHLKIYYMEESNGDILLKLGGETQKLKTITFEQAQVYCEQNFIKFVIKKYTNQDLLERYFEQVTKNSLDKVEIINESSIIEDFDSERFQEDMKESVDMMETIEGYITSSQFRKGLDKYILVDKVKELYSNIEHGELS